MLRRSGNLTTNHTNNTNFLSEILFFIHEVGVVREVVKKVNAGTLSNSKFKN
jgi:hypothetical protein